MNAITPLGQPGAAVETAVLVLADVQQFWELDHPIVDADFLAAVENCQLALAAARAANIPVAFMRRSYPWLLTSTAWLPGFLPARSDMIFERIHHSCYASHAFVQMAAATGGFALAGFFSESTAVATAIDARSHGGRLTFLSDASWSSPTDGHMAREMHKAATTVTANFGGVCTTDAWISAVAWGRK